MKNSTYITILLLSVFYRPITAQKINLEPNNLTPNQIYLSLEKLNNEKVIKLIKDSTVKLVDEPTFAKLKNIRFQNGIIEVKVLSRLLQNAPVTARGFIGLAFRIDDKNQQFESIYIRPTNGRADDQARRNHSIQYFSYPDYKFDKLR